MVEASDHRISSEELDALFSRDIAPRFFADCVPSAPPVIVFLGGQPAAGKSRAVASALARHTDMAKIVGDEFRRFHPAYRELMENDPLAVADATAQASGAWVTRSLDHAYENNYSVVVEGTFRNPQTTLDTLERFARKGYRTEVVALATREDRSRLDKVTRFLDPANDQPRWVANSHHDLAYAKAPETVQACEESPHLNRISVTNRAGEDLFSNERGPDGQWQRPPGAAEALLRERSVPPDKDEARLWLADYQRHSRTIVDRGELGTTTLPTFTKLYSDADRNAEFAYPTAKHAESRLEHDRTQQVQRRVLEAATSGASPEELRRERDNAERDADGPAPSPAGKRDGPDEAQRTSDRPSAARDEHETTAMSPQKPAESASGLDDKLHRIRAANTSLRQGHGDAEARGKLESESAEREDSRAPGQRDQGREPGSPDGEQRLRGRLDREDDGIER